MEQGISGISVIVCCYNSAERLPQTLQHLANQQLPVAISWELIVVNNNSSDQTKSVAEDLWETYGAPVEMSIIDEAEPGLTHARNAGIKASHYDILLFCDDDNWLDSNYIFTVSKRFNEHINLGALGGWCESKFEDKEPEWFQRFEQNFAVGKVLKTSGFLNLPHEYIYGAGMVVRKSALNQLYEKGFKSILTDRKGKQLSSGGDVELIFALKLIGVQIYFDEALHFYHFMPKNRMNWAYLLKIRKSMEWSNFVLNIYIDAQKQVPFNIVSLTKRFIKTFNNIRDLQKKKKGASKYEALFIENKIAIRRLFLKHPFFYFSTRKKLSKLKHE